MAVRTPTFLNNSQLLALTDYRSTMDQLCDLAGRPDQAAEFVTRGVSLRTAHERLVEAGAENLPTTWPLAEEALAARSRREHDDEQEDGSTAAGTAIAFEDSDQAAAVAYAAEVGTLCRLAGFPERALAALDRGVSIRLLRTELQSAQRARTAANPVDNAHDFSAHRQAAGQAFYDKVYEARAQAMGQAYHPRMRPIMPSHTHSPSSEDPRLG